jgi:hypothetical protein
VQVDAERHDARYRQVERRDVVAAVAPGGQHQAADARVHVHRDAALAAGGGDLRHRVEDAVRVAHGGRDREDAAIGERGRHAVRGRRERDRVERHGHDVQAEPFGRLDERRVRALRQHELAPRRAAGPRRPAVARRLHRQQARLGPAGRERPDGVRRCGEDVEQRADDVVLHRCDARERGRVQRVDRRERGERRLLEPAEDRVAVLEDVREQAPALVRDVRAAHGFEGFEDLGGRAAVNRQTRGLRRARRRHLVRHTISSVGVAGERAGGSS